MIRYAALMAVLFLFGCSGSGRLSDADRAKLDPPLQRLLSGKQIAETDYDISIRQDGTKEYAVIIRSRNPDEVKSAGIRISSAYGEVLTARVSRDELAGLLRLPSVRFVESSSRNSIQ